MAFGFGFGMPRIFSASRAFNPASLFANGEQGWWYDPSNFATLFQDSAGTTPVTAVEQPVGLQLDLSKGLALGPTLVTNGDFSGGTTTGWTPNGTATPTLSVVSGELRVSIASATGQIRAVQTLTLVLGKTYKLVSTTRRVIGDNTFLRITSSSDGSSAGQLAASVNTATSNTEIQLVFTATATTLYLALGVGINSGTANLEGFFDNISVRELPGNHRFQTTSANRPVVSARVNLLTKTEQFDDAAVWSTASNVTIAANTPETTDPLGTNTADKITEAATTATHRVLATGITPVGNTSYKLTFRAKKGTRSWCRLFFGSLVSGNGTSVEQYFNLDTLAKGTQVTTQSSGSTVMVVFTSSSIEDIGSGWRLLTMVVTTQNSPTELQVAFGLANADAVLSYAGSTSEYGYIWGADLRPANQGVGLPAYQRVNTSTDYDSTGFPTYIKPNGSNQFMVTNSINFTATDKMTVWQGVRKLSDAANGVLVELSSSISTNNGVFTIQAPQGASAPFNHYTFASKGTAFGLATTATGYPSPITNVLTGIGDISGDIATLRINGVQTAQGIENQGTGNFGNYPAYFYMRGGTILPFNGNDYGSIARGAASTTAQITNGETYINSLTKAY